MAKTALQIAEDTYKEIEAIIEERKRKAEAEGCLYYTPFAIGQEADKRPFREGQIDICEQTMMEYVSGPLRE